MVSQLPVGGVHADWENVQDRQLIIRNIERARAYVDDLFKPSSTSARRRLRAKIFLSKSTKGKRQIKKGE